ncbi:hypothetical protein BC941DRAFT_211248 [Chlamydoabsidia padenii]|nr:hypothetical protein BC941DRAFT_211248 [Chlamydoabsidia padenii]
MTPKDKIIHRVKVLNLPSKETVQIKKLFNTHGIKKFKKAPQWNYAYITFDSKIAAQETMATLNGIQFKKRTLATEYAQISEEVFRQRFFPPPPPQQQQKQQQQNEKVDNRNFAERLADQVTPLYK